MTLNEIAARTEARMKWLKENLSPEEWAQVVGCPDDPDGQHHSACGCDGVDPINPNAAASERLYDMRFVHLKQAGAMAAFAEQLEREGEARAAVMADNLAEFYRQWAEDPSVVPPDVEPPPPPAAARLGATVSTSADGVVDIVHRWLDQIINTCGSEHVQQVHDEHERLCATLALLRVSAPRVSEPSSSDLPPHLAVDGDGYVWRVYDDCYWSMARTNPDNSPTPAPITYYAPLVCPGCGVGIRPGVAACNSCVSEANTDPNRDSEAFEGWGPGR